MQTKVPTTKQEATPKPTSLAPGSTPVAAVPATRSTSVRQEDVCRLAYQKWEAAGRPEGKDVQFWLEAERECLKGK